MNLEHKTILNSALRDPAVYIGRETLSQDIRILVAILKDYEWVSVWKEQPKTTILDPQKGEADYIYRRHGVVRGQQLKYMFENMIRGDNPKLEGVYSYEDLEKIVREQNDKDKPNPS